MYAFYTYHKREGRQNSYPYNTSLILNCKHYAVVNDRNGISPEPDRNRNMDFLPNRNRTGTETHYRNISINIFSDLRICKEFLINILKTTADFL